jgi:hypothetical protein
MDLPGVAPDEHSNHDSHTGGQPACPCCGGPLFPCRCAFQCGRCHFLVCEGCTGAEGPLDLGD